MSIIKIQRVKNLKKIVAYATQKHKTRDDLITTFSCDIKTIEEDFNDILKEYNSLRKENRGISARMIIQSFNDKDQVSPEEAHRYGVEFVRNYLKDEHQYFVVTHIESDHIHNHIVFNDINFETMKYFDSKRENSLHRLHYENDKILEKNNLHVIEKNKTKIKYYSFQEYAVRLKGKSFKAQLENAIDKNIELAKDYDDFFKLMKEDGYESKQGKYLAFQNPKSNKFMRTKTLGVNYLENSIKYRIENKDYVPVKPNVINKEWIDKTADKFKNNKGLERWATIQNINYLNEINVYLYKEKVTLEEYSHIKSTAESLMKNFGEELHKIDKTINDLEKMSGAFEGYKQCHDVMAEYKSIQDKNERANFKKAHYATFKKFDTFKKNINTLKNDFHINNESELQHKLAVLKVDRDLLYEGFNVNNPKRVVELEEKKKALQEYAESERDTKNLVDAFEREVGKLDKKIAKLESLSGAFEQYKGFYSTMATFKRLDDKEEARKQFKNDNYEVFKAYDVVLDKLGALKELGIKDEPELQYKISSLKNDRNLMKESLEENKKERSREQEQERQRRQQEQQRKKNRSQER